MNTAFAENEWIEKTSLLVVLMLGEWQQILWCCFEWSTNPDTGFGVQRRVDARGTEAAGQG
ncbi:hypothetical protein [Limosilactobacillus difficilis]|uniref:hypothetical protein n=1 Tax=Limosilactobacillus difficilis TaxID=2991838 RepID=UPI0024B927AE|nr:hypothetical protein [Limosilactobacillus difficilis]